MGFDREMVMNLIKYQSDRIDGNPENALNLLLKTESGWEHKFIGADDDFGTHDIENPMYNLCQICNEKWEEHVESQIPEERYITPGELLRVM